MDEYQISVNKLAVLTKLSMSIVRNITMGKGSFTPSTALRLAKLFGTTPEYWLDIQTRAALAKAAQDPELTEALKTITKAAKPASAKAPSAGKTAASTSKGKKVEKPAKRGKSAAAAKAKPAAKKTGGKAIKTETAIKTARKPRTKKA
jgi:addiction module HigA family antidote